MKSLERELQSYKAEIDQLKETFTQQKIVSGELEAECARLRSALMDAQFKVGSADDDDESKERIAGRYLPQPST